MNVSVYLNFRIAELIVLFYISPPTQPTMKPHQKRDAFRWLGNSAIVHKRIACLKDF
jgi:hypothetical protein